MPVSKLKSVTRIFIELYFVFIIPLLVTTCDISVAVSAALYRAW